MDQDRGNIQQQSQRKLSWGERWEKARPTKAGLFWACLASIVLTIIIGFTWGGWVTKGTAEKTAATMTEQAVVARLSPMCVIRFNEDLGKEQKLKELKEMNSWSRSDYVQKQGWATMSGEQEPDRKVADECAKLLMTITQTTSSL